jgi:hypothetical protein
MHPYLRYQAIPMFPQLKVRTREQSRATGRPRERSLFPVGSQPQRLAAGDLRHGILRRRRSVLVEDNLVASLRKRPRRRCAAAGGSRNVDGQHHGEQKKLRQNARRADLVD